ncbi:MAG: MBL fold metallo-hydrolase [Planctomycetales bacterium]|nr:MBL fold metallo-hydrolase [Planctomycetales bacterium]
MSSSQELNIHCIVSQPFAENTYVVHLAGSQQCLVIDPGFDPQAIIEYLNRNQLTPAMVLNTHGHSDHIAGNEAIKQHWPACPLVIGTGDAPKLTDPVLNLSAPFGLELLSPPADRTVDHGDIIDAAGIRLEVRDTPGHSCGHVVFVWLDGPTPIVFGGDVLFQGSVGRTDFPDGDTAQLMKSIQEQLFTLPDQTRVYPGHGDDTTVGDEKQFNPYCRLR